MSKYRKKPVVIEAWKFNKEEFWFQENGEFPDWLFDAMGDQTVSMNNGTTYISTLEGDMMVSDGDYIIRGVKGELYPCKPDIFEATYEDVAE